MQSIVDTPPSADAFNASMMDCFNRSVLAVVVDVLASFSYPPGEDALAATIRATGRPSRITPITSPFATRSK
jgi:hypothetical protein